MTDEAPAVLAEAVLQACRAPPWRAGRSPREPPLLVLGATMGFAASSAAHAALAELVNCLLYTSPSPRDLSTSRMPSSA